MSTLAQILEGIATRLRTIAGLRVFDYMPDALAPPAAIVQLPRAIDFDLTFGRGSDTLDIRVLVVVGKASDRASTLNLAAYLNPDGASSVKAAVEADPTLGGRVDECEVTRADGIGSYTIAGQEFAGALFTLSVIT